MINIISSALIEITNKTQNKHYIANLHNLLHFDTKYLN